MFELEHTYKLRANTSGKKLQDFIKIPIRVTFNKDFVIKTVCIHTELNNPTVCKRIQVVLQGGDRMIIDDVQYNAAFGA